MLFSPNYSVCSSISLKIKKKKGRIFAPKKLWDKEKKSSFLTLRNGIKKIEENWKKAKNNQNILHF